MFEGVEGGKDGDTANCCLEFVIQLMDVFDECDGWINALNSFEIRLGFVYLERFNYRSLYNLRPVGYKLNWTAIYHKFTLKYDQTFPKQASTIANQLHKT